jgi:hypothetical protein
MAGGTTQAWRAFTNEIGSGWVSNTQEGIAWIQMPYPSSIWITSVNIFSEVPLLKPKPRPPGMTLSTKSTMLVECS